MALVLEANYSKKIGLPAYSSHQFSITLKTEITDPAQIQSESIRLYGLLQSSVDQSLQQVGWLTEARKTRLFKQIESYQSGLERQDFVPSPGFHCAGCEFYKECRNWS